MSILIKGMEMPSEQYGKMVITLYPNGHVAEYVGDMGRVWEAIPVVRCKDCKHYRSVAGYIDGYCHMAEWYRRYQYPDDYCSRGERKDDEHSD